MNKYLNHFNFIYDTHYRNEDSYLDLQNKKIEDSGLQLICKIKFTKLKYLDLKNNNIKDITTLSESKTNLADISVFDKVNFYQFEHLTLSKNRINYKIPKNQDIIFNLLIKEYIVDI